METIQFTTYENGDSSNFNKVSTRVKIVVTQITHWIEESGGTRIFLVGGVSVLVDKSFLVTSSSIHDATIMDKADGDA